MWENCSNQETTSTCKTYDSLEDVTIWKHFPYYWPFVRRIQSLVDFTHKMSSNVELGCFLCCKPERAVGQSQSRWFWVIGSDTEDLHFNDIRWVVDLSAIPINYANPVYGVATICHQVRWLRWGHPNSFNTATHLLIWYQMFCVRNISYRFIWMEFINMFSVYAPSGTHSRFNW